MDPVFHVGTQVKMSRSRAWCFTLNNPTPEERQVLDELEVRYLVYGNEVGENGTPHLQGYVVFLNPVTLAQAKGRLSTRVHLEKTQGTPKQASDYCKKDGDFVERGDLPAQGKRSDIHDLKDAINGGERNLKRLRQEHPIAMARYGKFARELLMDTRPPPEKPAIILRQWQVDLLHILRGPVHDRRIYWYADFNGAAGKSTFATWLEADLELVQVMKPGKLGDLAYALDENIRILIMDCPRCREGVFPYSFLEDVKDKRVFNSKYDVYFKHLKPVHVVVFANFKPEENAFSPDRPLIVELSETPDSAVTQVIEIDD